jgi:hypothetical protein
MELVLRDSGAPIWRAATRATRPLPLRRRAVATVHEERALLWV